MTVLVPLMPEVSDELVVLMIKQAMREKSVFRAAAFRCLLAMSEKRPLQPEPILDAMIDALTKGAFVAQQAAAGCAKIVKDLPKFADFLDLVYKGLDKVDADGAIPYCKLLLELPEHEVPLGFYPHQFERVAHAFGHQQTVDRLMARFPSPC
jgi:hypothetical protein